MTPADLELAALETKLRSDVSRRTAWGVATLGNSQLGEAHGMPEATAPARPGQHGGRREVGWVNAAGSQQQTQHIQGSTQQVVLKSEEQLRAPVALLHSQRSTRSAG
jgi:hypothetical protein